MDEVVYVRQGKLLVPEKPEQVKQRLVRLENAEQEINKVKEGAKGTYRVMLEIELSLLKAEREKWKKKLQQEYAKNKKIAKETSSPLWREGARWNMRLIEELLKQ